MNRVSSKWSAVIVTVVSLPNLVAPAQADDFYVDSTGAIPGSYATVQAALDGVPSGTADNRSVIRIQPGTYTEKLTLSGSKSFITLRGTTDIAADTVLTFNLNATSDNGAGGTVGTTGSSSTTINGSDVIAANLTFANSTPDNVAQAVAIKTNGDRIAFQNVRFIGFQDTLYIDGSAGNPHRVYIRDSYVTGDTDFIFGRGTGVFESSTINSSSSQYITAARTEAASPYGFVFFNSTFTRGPNPDIPAAANGAGDNTTYLGRPWQWDSVSPVVRSNVVLIDSFLGPHILDAGWHPWDVAANTMPQNNTFYAEYNSRELDGDPVNVAGRVPWSHQLTAQERAQYTLANIFGDWDPLEALSSLNVPEPGTAGLLTCGVSVLVLSARRRTG